MNVLDNCIHFSEAVEANEAFQKVLAQQKGMQVKRAKEAAEKKNKP